MAGVRVKPSFLTLSETPRQEGVIPDQIIGSDHPGAEIKEMRRLPAVWDKNPFFTAFPGVSSFGH